ncbi:hypothetical protein SCP_0112220 [Sparassis crispa]|uniref:Uncharacterized protein n=1 Tax=Sparassis crispa TaxID=139825 RepID=A0A401G859_9APHY|nr:hypothetical protein SCP_0112220 [Sparassis crispa]GBE78337.1 hypothetical protein SCP_0112220 [Sparassis crispa]
MDGPLKVWLEECSRNVNEFFSKTYMHEGRKYRNCRECRKASKIPADKESDVGQLVAEVSTLHHHLESRHKAKYTTWVEHAKFDSMLPKEVKH